MIDCTLFAIFSFSDLETTMVMEVVVGMLMGILRRMEMEKVMMETGGMMKMMMEMMMMMMEMMTMVKMMMMMGTVVMMEGMMNQILRLV